MSSFTFGFVISQLTLLNRTDFSDPHLKKLCIKVYARPEIHRDLDQTVRDAEDLLSAAINLNFSTEIVPKNREVLVVNSIVPWRGFSFGEVGHRRIAELFYRQTS